MDGRLTFTILIVSSFTIDFSSSDHLCYMCLYAKTPQQESGSLLCLNPEPHNNKTQLEACKDTQDTQAQCYTTVVRVEDAGNDVTYVQRGCLPGCKSNPQYNVQDYGFGSMACCEGDLCNAATSLHASAALSLAVLLYVKSLYC